MTKKRIVFIPFWVQDILSRNKMQLADCLNIGKIKPVMALNDLLGFSALQNMTVPLLGAAIHTDELYWIWLQGAGEDLAQRRFLNDTVLTLARDPSYTSEVQSRLFHADALSSQHEKPFITYDLSPEVIGVVVYPGFFTGNGQNDLQKSLVSAILKLLYVYETSHEVAKTPLFKRYLELLSLK